MKKLLIMIMVFAMAFSAIAFADSGIEAEISVQVEEDWEAYYDAAIERVLADNPNATINKIVIGSFDHFDILTQTDALNEDFADVFAMPADRFAGLFKNDVLAAIDAPAMAETVGGFDDYDAGLGGMFEVDGEYFGFPMNIETLLIFANKANLEASGLDSEEPIEIIGNEQHFLLPFFDTWFGVAAMNAGDVELLGMEEDGTLFSDMTLDWDELSPEKQAVIEGLYDYWKYNNDNDTALFDSDSGWGYIDDSFAAEGDAIFRLGGPWETSSNVELAGHDGENIAVFPIDHFTLAGNPLAHWKGGWALAVNARVEEDADKLALAEALITEIMNPEYAVEFFEAAGKIMENVPAEFYADSDLADIDKLVIEAVIDGYQNAPARPLFEEWGQVWDTFTNGVLSWNNVKPESAEEAYNELKASFDAMMAGFEG